MPFSPALVAALVLGAAPQPPPAGESETAALQAALSAALQAHGTEAVARLRKVDPARLSARDAETRRCMLARLGTRRASAAVVEDPVIAEVLAAYRAYWTGSLLAARPRPTLEARLLARLRRLVAAGEKPAASLDDLEPALEKLIGAHGYHALLGVTSPLRELMLWKTETEANYDVPLPEATQPVTVVFLDGFASLGWAGFATCDRHHSGGWTRPDKLYAVRSAYDVASEDFRVSYLAHEAQHFLDGRRFPALPQAELEARAKLAELAMGSTTLLDLLESFAANVGDDPSVPHSFANRRVVEALAGRLLPSSAGPPAWRSLDGDRIRAAAAALLREDTVRLQSR